MSLSAGKAVPSAVEPVRMSCRFGVSPRPLMTSPFSDRLFCLLSLLLALCRSSTLVGDDDALGIHPGPLADAVARVDRAGALRRQISVPGLAARARRRRELLAMLVGAGKPAEIGALAGAGAGDEERHIGLLRRAQVQHTRTQDTPPAARRFERLSSEYLPTLAKPVAPPSGDSNTGAPMLYSVVHAR